MLEVTAAAARQKRDENDRTCVRTVRKYAVDSDVRFTHSMFDNMSCSGLTGMSKTWNEIQAARRGTQTWRFHGYIQI